MYLIYKQIVLKGENMSNTNDNFSVAAARHFVDGELLQNQNRFNNAMCHYAFAAECAMKAMYEQVCANKGRKLGHELAQEWSKIEQYYFTLRILDAKAGTLFSKMSLPDKVFERHPERRYEKDIHYEEEDVEEARLFTGQLIHKIVSDALDGSIEVKE